MGQETVIYLTNIIIVAILAGMITHHWVRQGRSEAMLFWMLSAWVMLVADILFAARPGLPHWFSRFVPTLLVTVGQAGLYMGAQKTAEMRIHRAMLIGVIVVHAAGLIYFLNLGYHSDWRKVFNGAIWAGLSLGAFWCLRKANPFFWKPLVAPATAFLLHGLFHCARLGLASVFAIRNWEAATASLQIVGDLEVSFFMVALFVGILAANLQVRNEELRTALDEVHTLSGLLPICAWCKKVRDDDGYWQKVEDYFASRSQITFTHGICAECFGKHVPKQEDVPTR